MRDFLIWLARGQTWIHRFLETILKIIYPYSAAAVAYRRGNLSTAKSLSHRRRKTLLAQRTEQMLNILNAGRALPDQPPPRQTKFNGSILFAVHSNGAYDTNGYAVRTEQALDAISKKSLSITVTTRPGYPWDLEKHATKPRMLTSTAGQHEYLHLTDETGLRRPELDYISDYAIALAQIARDEKVCVIHAHSNYLNGLAAAIAGRKVGCGVIYEMRGLWHVTRSSADPDYKNSEHYSYCELMELEAARMADRVVAISGALKTWLAQRDVDPEKIVVVGNIADPIPGIFEGRSTRIRSQKDTFHLGYIGALSRYEGLDVLLEAVHLLVKEQVRVNLTIAGDGAYAKALQRLSSHLGLTKQVRFLGRVPREQTPILYQSFDACPLPRRAYTVTELIPPLKPFEIMVHGVPIIVSNLPPLAEIVAHEKRGLVFRPDCPESLAEAILKIRDNSALAEQMAREAANWVAAEASSAQMGRLYSDVYRDMCAPSS